MIRGLSSLLTALGLFRLQPRLLLMLMLAPWGISLVLFLGSWSLLTIWLTGQVDPYLQQVVDGWWQTLLVGLGNFIAVVIAGGLAYLSTVIGAMVIAAPFHDRLSAATERAAYPDRSQAVGSLGILPALKEGVKTAGVLILAEVALLPLHFLPGLGHLLFALLSGILITLGLLDIPLARREWTLKQKRQFVGRNFASVVGLALPVVAISLVPLLNLLSIPLVVMAATLLVAERE